MIFPTLSGTKGGYLNLNDWSIKCAFKQGYVKYPKPSPYLEPAACQYLVEGYHKARDLAYSFGGYHENRYRVWGGSYLEKERKFIHLGIDYNAPVGTPVAVDRTCEIVLVDDDTPDRHGWGTRVIVRLLDEPMYLIYAHIKLKVSLSLAKGSILHPGTVFAEIAPSNCNGYWYPHVHVQAMSPEAYQEFLRYPPSLDGYGSLSQTGKLARFYPNPMRYVDIK